METTVIERRRHPRVPSDHTVWRELRLRTGDRLVLIDIAAGGALVESVRRLMPGTALVVHLSSQTHALSVRAVVVRCSVWALAPEGGVRYRGALCFDEEVSDRGGRGCSAAGAGPTGTAPVPVGHC